MRTAYCCRVCSCVLVCAVDTMGVLFDVLSCLFVADRVSVEQNHVLCLLVVLTLC